MYPLRTPPLRTPPLRTFCASEDVSRIAQPPSRESKEVFSVKKNLFRLLMVTLLVALLVPMAAFAEDAVAIDAANFPDANFRSYVADNFDPDGDGFLSQQEREAVTSIDVGFKEISSLDGVGFFSALQTLSCYKNKLTSLDVSGCTSLEYLNCGSNQLTSLEISGCTSLEYLGCGSNKLTSLDVSGCTSLEELSCSGNQLTSLDISGCPSLITLHCGSNQLTSLEIGDCPSLTYLYCDSNQLTSLDIGGCPSLKYLYCVSNQLTSLDISGSTSLENLSCMENQLTSLDVSGCTSLNYLYCPYNQLTSLDISGCASLEDLYCYKNKLTSLDISSCTSLITLDCYNNQLTSLDISGYTSLNYLYCPSNQLTSLDASGCPSLKYLYCYDNQLTSLDVSGCTSLGYLECGDNQLTNMDVSGCTQMVGFTCDNNSYEVVPDADGTFDLTTLPGSFDAAKAANWTGGTVSGSILTAEAGATQAAYTYDCGNGFTADFTLTFGTPAAPKPEPTATFTQASVSLAGDIGLNFYVQLSEDLVQDSDAFIRFTFDDQVQQVLLSEGLKQKDGTNRYSCKLAAKDMACAVTAQMCTSDGPVGEPGTFSVTDYCTYVINRYAGTNQQGKLVNLLKAMLNYGAQSQISLKHNTADLANTGIDTTLPSPGDLSAYRASASGSEDGILVYSTSLLLKTTTTIRVYFQLTGDKSIDQYSFTANGKAVQPVKSGELYYVDLVGVEARNLDTMYQISCGGLTVNYCGLSYVKSTLEYPGFTEDARNMAKALYGYAMAANEYFVN